MKIQNLFLLIILLLFSRCDESERGQYPIDSIPPGEVIPLNIENLPGGAIIYYQIPDDDDLLYVKATYKRDNGTETEQIVSSYSREIPIEGISKSREVEVKLFAVDRSRNEGNPVIVNVSPLDSPIHSSIESINTFDDFGGIRLNWSNPTGSEMVICVETPNEEGELENVRNFYTNTQVGTGYVRGYTEETTFFIYIRDLWDNHSDTISIVANPLFEEELKEGMSRWNPTGIPYSAYSNYHIENIWDGNFQSFFIAVTLGEFPFSFTFDLGKKLKISRIKQVQRQGIFYTSQNIRYFELWGTNTPNLVSDDFEGWIKLGDFEIIKPSGLPIGQRSDEDNAVAFEGHDLNVDPEAPPVRYIRYVIKATWGGDPYACIAELKFFGDIEK